MNHKNVQDNPKKIPYKHSIKHTQQFHKTHPRLSLQSEVSEIMKEIIK